MNCVKWAKMVWVNQNSLSLVFVIHLSGIEHGDDGVLPQKRQHTRITNLIWNY